MYCFVLSFQLLDYVPFYADSHGKQPNNQIREDTCYSCKSSQNKSRYVRKLPKKRKENEYETKRVGKNHNRLHFLKQQNFIQ